MEEEREGTFICLVLARHTQRCTSSHRWEDVDTGLPKKVLCLQSNPKFISGMTQSNKCIHFVSNFQKHFFLSVWYTCNFALCQSNGVIVYYMFSISEERAISYVVVLFIRIQFSPVNVSQMSMWSSSPFRKNSYDLYCRFSFLKKKRFFPRMIFERTGDNSLKLLGIIDLSVND
jgi:hypothetical protein